MVAVTLIYVVLTAYVAREAGRSAQAAEKSAEGAVRAAEAAERAAVLAEASLDVDFSARYGETSADGCLFLTCLGSRVLVDGVVLSGSISYGGTTHVLHDTELPWRAPPVGPTAVRKGETLMFGWPTPDVDLGQRNAAFVLVCFRVSEGDAESRLERPVSFGYDGYF